MGEDNQSKTLLAGADYSLEFGWLLCTWIPVVRAYSHKFEKTVVVCRSGHNYLYEFADEIINYDKKGLPDRWLLDGKKAKMPQRIIERYPDAKLCRPRQKKCEKWPREYFKYGHEDYEEYESYIVVIHARACTKYGQKAWNWPVDKYSKTLQALNIDPRDCCSVGTEAHHIPRTQDLRGISLKRLCHIMACSKVVLSPSSGPAHLASLCGTPHVVITDNKYQKSIKGTNKQRYKKLWNPFQTPCKVVDKFNWQPPVEKVVKAMRKFV